jgi:hypothetical protein
VLAYLQFGRFLIATTLTMVATDVSVEHSLHHAGMLCILWSDLHVQTFLEVVF